MSNTDKKLSKNERRAAARERARELHEARVRREKRNRVLTVGGIVLAAVAVVVAVVLVIVNGIRPASPGPENMASDGIVIGEGLQVQSTPGIPVDGTSTPTEQTDEHLQIVVYHDYMCPHCGAFDQTNGSTIRDLVNSGLATVEYHPMAYMDRASLGAKFSTRASNAAACVAQFQADVFFDWNELMFLNQPEQSTQGLTDDQMLGFMEQAGADMTPELTDCVKSIQFESWVGDAAMRAASDPVPYTYEGADPVVADRTPTILVNGRHYQGPNTDAAVFQQFLQSVQGELQAASGDVEDPEE